MHCAPSISDRPRLASSFILSLVAGLLSISAWAQAESDQRDADELDSGVAYNIEVIADDLDYPWSLGFLPNGDLLVTERTGQLRLIRDGQLLAEPVAGVPDVFASSQGGLMGLLIDPEFEQNQTIYLSLAHGTDEANATRVVRARLNERALSDVEILFTAEPTKDTPVHYGGRMTWLGDGTMVIGLGDGFDYREQAQRLDTHFGSIVRINPDGSIPPDNPFIGQADALPEIHSYGHRNIQGLVFDAETGTLWQHEHGPRGGDELNRIEPAQNYGWPVATHGIDYSGALISPYESRPDMVDPLWVWTPSIAPSGMTLYRGGEFPEWNGDLLVTALVSRNVRRMDLEDGEVVREDTLFDDIGQRLRDIRTAPDGSIYLLTDSSEGQLLRVTASR